MTRLSPRMDCADGTGAGVGAAAAGAGVGAPGNRCDPAAGAGAAAAGVGVGGGVYRTFTGDAPGVVASHRSGLAYDDRVGEISILPAPGSPRIALRTSSRVPSPNNRSYVLLSRLA